MGIVLSAFALAILASTAQVSDSSGASEPAPGTAGRRPRLVVASLPKGIEAPRIDGDLGDAAWEIAARLGDLMQVEPVAGASPSRSTDVRLLFDGEALYLGFRCFDDQPVRATIRQRDVRQRADDHIAIVIDPFVDGRNAYVFFLSAAGAIADGVISKSDSQRDFSWDAIWQGRARVTPHGWEGEMRIPVSSISHESFGTTWGFNLRRNIPRTQELLRWADPEPSRAIFDVSQAGRIEGLALSADRSILDVRPFLVGDAVRERDLTAGGDDKDVDLELDVGVDAFYRITPSVKLSLSVNTDFAETEIDQRLVNRTRFPLFFPEKRAFFLEDTEVFFFGPPQVPELNGPALVGVRDRPDNIPFFTRTIGLDALRREVPLLLAGKLTGRSSAGSFGVLGVRTDDSNGLEAQSLAAARYSENILKKSDVGVLLTAGDPKDAGGDGTWGVDLNLRTDEFGGEGNKRLRFSAYVLQSVNSADGDDLAYHASLSYPNDTVELALEHSVFQENYDPALGFLLRRGVKKYRADAYWRPRLDRSNGILRQLEFGFTPVLFTGADDDRTQIVDVVVRVLGLLFESGDALKFNVFHQRDVLQDSFEIVRGFANTIVAPGAYTFTSVGASFEASDKRPLSGSATVEAGDFYDGERLLLTGRMAWRPSALITTTVGLEHDRLDLPADAIDVNVASTSLNWQLTPDHSWLTVAQYDDVTEQVALFSRFEWNTQFGGALFLVFDRAWSYTPDSLIPGDGALTVKVGYTIRL